MRRIKMMITEEDIERIKRIKQHIDKAEFEIVNDDEQVIDADVVFLLQIVEELAEELIEVKDSIRKYNRGVF
jgi:hypothetical protein